MPERGVGVEKDRLVEGAGAVDEPAEVEGAGEVEGTVEVEGAVEGAKFLPSSPASGSTG